MNFNLPAIMLLVLVKMMKSLVSDAEIYHIDDYLTTQEAGELMTLLNREDRFTFHKMYWKRADGYIAHRNHRQSYWFGQYAQSMQDARELSDFTLPYHFPEPVLKLKQRIEKDFDCMFNSCLVGKYDNQRQKIGAHSDESSHLGDDPTIVSISLGAPRNFKIIGRHKSNKKTKINLILNSGSCLVLKNGANANYLHMVHRDPQCNKDNIRINLTFRNYTYDEHEKKIVASPF